jgi:hypothetical protein
VGVGTVALIGFACYLRGPTPESPSPRALMQLADRLCATAVGAIGRYPHVADSQSRRSDAESRHERIRNHAPCSARRGHRRADQSGAGWHHTRRASLLRTQQPIPLLAYYYIWFNTFSGSGERICRWAGTANSAG